MKEVTADLFRPHIGSRFKARLGDADSVELQLSSVSESTVSASAARSKPFALVFAGPPAPVLSQQIHSLEHEGLGRIDLFLVPIGPDATTGAMRYEAIFN